MPFKSKAQAAFMFSQHPEIAKRWEAETKNMKKLPKHVKKKTTKKKTSKKTSKKKKGK
jgi:hypothetical protein